MPKRTNSKSKAKPQQTDTGVYPQEPPFCIQLELVEGCSLNCTFCGVQGIRASKGGYKFMTTKTMSLFCKRLRNAMSNEGWNPRIELAVHGEPTMHPDLINMVAKLGALKPRELILVSNGSGLVKDTTNRIDQLAQAGITSFCLDEYDGCDFVERIRSNYNGNVPFYNFTGPDAEKFRGGKPKPPYVVIKEDVTHLTTPYDKPNTHCGGGGKPSATNPAIDKRCAKPFRELTVRWDGNVALCCNDFRGVYKIANLRDHATLTELWHHPAFDAARRRLYHNDRRFAPCQWCDAVSPRVGLLPDKKGSDEMPPPTKETNRLIDQAIAGNSYTLPVLRGWEVGKNAEKFVGPNQKVDGLQIQPIDRRKS